MTPEEILTAANERFYNGDSYKAVSEFLAANGVSKDQTIDAFNTLFDSGLGFLPGLSSWGIASNRRAPVNAKARDAYVKDTAEKDARAILREEHPFMARVFPGFLQGKMKDAREGNGESALRDFRRTFVDVDTLIPRFLGAGAGTAANAVLGTDWHMANMDDPDSAMNDPWLLPSMAIPFGTVATVPLAGKALIPKAITASGNAVRSALNVGRGLVKAPGIGGKAYRFAFDTALDAGGTIGASRISDRTEAVDPGLALVAGVAGTGVGRGTDAVGSMIKLRRAKNAAPVDDEVVKFATSSSGLNLKPEELPSAVLNTHGGVSTAEQLERTLASSPSGEAMLQRQANLIRVVTTRIDDVLGSAVDGYTPSRSAADVIHNLRASWAKIKQEALKDHFNFSNRFDGNLADDLIAAEDESFKRLAADLAAEKAISRELERMTAPNNTLGALDKRIADLEKRIESLHGAQQLESPYYKELDLLYTLKEQTLKGRDILPSQRLRQLDEVRKSLQDFLDVNKNEALPSRQKKFAETLKQMVKRDQEDILRSGWFGEAGEAAFPVWKESAEKAEKFLAGEAELGKFLNPRKVNERGLENILTDGTVYFPQTVRDALEQGGEEGARRLADLRRLALSETLANEAKEGIPWTSTLRRLRKAAPGLDALMDPADPIRSEVMNIVRVGSRAGAPIEAGSAFAKNSSLFSPSLWAKRARYAWERGKQLRELGFNGKNGAIIVDPGAITKTLASKGVRTDNTLKTIASKSVRNGAKRATQKIVGNKAGETATTFSNGRDDAAPPPWLDERLRELWIKYGWRPAKGGAFRTE